jgi:hypothetical protein
MTLTELIDEMKLGQKIAHIEFESGEYITIKNDIFVNQNDKEFKVKPWMLEDEDFFLLEEADSFEEDSDFYQDYILNDEDDEDDYV